MEVLKQLSVFLENKPGILAELLRSFKEGSINVLAISVMDTVDHAVIRMVVSDPEKALHLMEERGTLVLESEVLGLRILDEPGMLEKVAEKMAEVNVNIEYAYGTADGPEKKCLMIMRVSDLKKAQRALRKELV